MITFHSESFRSRRVTKTYRHILEKLHIQRGPSDRKFGNFLWKTDCIKKFCSQIKDEESLKYLTELRQVTVVCINMVPSECTVYELISLADQLFEIIQKYLRWDRFIGIEIVLCNC